MKSRLFKLLYQFSTYSFYVVGVLLLCTKLQAASFPLPNAGNDLVGEIQYTEVNEAETLIDIAHRFDIGFNEIRAANPSIDPWLPKQGSLILIPTRYILPSTPRKGIIINLAEMRLYYYPKRKKGTRGMVFTFPLGIGREGWSTPVGMFKVVEKIVAPSWTVPKSILEEYKAEGIESPRVIPPGPDNPLGAFAITLDRGGYIIHGSSKKFGIGMRVSHGCLRLYAEDIEKLFNSVPRATQVRIIDQPIKVGKEGNYLFLEAHRPTSNNARETIPDNIPKNMVAGELDIISEKDLNTAPNQSDEKTDIKPLIAKAVGNRLKLTPGRWQSIIALTKQFSGMPVSIANTKKTKRNDEGYSGIGILSANNEIR